MAFNILPALSAHVLSVGRASAWLRLRPRAIISMWRRLDVNVFLCELMVADTYISGSNDIGMY